MRPRKQLLAGILALVAMTFSFGEMVAVAACAPGMGMETHEMGEAHGHADAASPAGTHEEHRGGDEGERDCPFGPAVASCTGVASFPSRVASNLVPRLHADMAVFREASEHHPLLSSALFHPPRA